jgi:hypothetical protein
MTRCAVPGCVIEPSNPAYLLDLKAPVAEPQEPGDQGEVETVSIVLEVPLCGFHRQIVEEVEMPSGRFCGSSRGPAEGPPTGREAERDSERALDRDDDYGPEDFGPDPDIDPDAEYIEWEAHTTLRNVQYGPATAR